jgi:tellurite methyltransferase
VSNWDERYRSGSYNKAGASELLVRAVELQPEGRKALDLACGAGRNAVYLADAGWSVTAVDYSGEALAILEREVRDKGLSIDSVKADLELKEFHFLSNCYDLIADFYYLQRDLWPLIKQAVSPGGLFVQETYVESEGEGPEIRSRFSLRKGELIRAFEGWDVEYYRETAGAGAHRGSFAQLIARKPRRH